MRRRTREDDPDAAEVAQVAQAAVWWAERAQVDRPLTVDEFRRYAALIRQRVDVRGAVAAILATSTAAPAVARSCSELARAEYARAASGMARRPE